MSREDSTSSSGGGGDDEFEWRLVRKGVQIEHFCLCGNMIFIGREDCDVTLQSQSVDKRHAVLTFDPGDKAFRVKDLNSTNGTFLNDVRIPEQSYVYLDHNDCLRFGYDPAVYQVQQVKKTSVESSSSPTTSSSSGDASNDSSAKVITDSSQEDGEDRLKKSSPSTENTQSNSASVEATTPSSSSATDANSSSQQPSPDKMTMLVTLDGAWSSPAKKPASESPPPLSRPAELVCSLSNASIHSTFSEDSLTSSTAAASAAAAPAPTPPSAVDVQQFEPERNVPNELFVSEEAADPAPPREEIPANVPNATEEPVHEDNNNTASSSKASPMAFTIDFGDSDRNMNLRKLDIGDRISRFAPKHKRNLSLTKLDENKSSTAKEVMKEKTRIVPPVSRKSAGSDSVGSVCSVESREEVANARKTSRPSAEKRRPPRPVHSPSLSESASFLIDKLLNSRECPAVEELLDEPPTGREEVEPVEAKDDVSETGTYTIDRDSSSPDLEKARQEIDQVFGVEEDAEQCKPPEPCEPTRHGTPNWIREWAAQVSQQNNRKSKMQEVPPGSPIHRAPLPPAPERERPRRRLPSLPTNRTPLTLPTTSAAVARPDNIENPDLETESYLRDTESVVTAMQARMGQSGGVSSLESPEESDVDDEPEPRPAPDTCASPNTFSKQLRAKLRLLEDSKTRNATKVYNGHQHVVKNGREEDSSASSDIGTEKIGIHYNRAFSTPDKKDSLKTAVKKKGPVPTKPAESKNAPAGKSPNQFSRVDGGRFSLRLSKGTAQQPTPTSVQSTPAKSKSVKKEAPKRVGSAGSGNRSNSSLSSKEVEFQNWKRRKSYDPMKAAAEGKKRDAAKKVAATPDKQPTVAVPPVETSRSPSPPSCVLRSASFHGTRPRPSEDSDAAYEEEECVLPPVNSLPPTSKRSSAYTSVSSASDGGCGGEWHRSAVTRKASLDESLLDDGKAFVRNGGLSSSLRSRNKLEPVDNLVISTAHSLSTKLKSSLNHLLKKLKIQYSDFSEPSILLDEVIDQLNDSEGVASSPVKSPSRELSGTLKNLKKIEQAVMVLDRVLFEDME